MHQIRIHSETDAAGGWKFTVETHVHSENPRRATMKLSYADYNLWCASGACAPADVARAVVRFMLEQCNELPDSFDASLARRRFPQADAVIPTLIQE